MEPDSQKIQVRIVYDGPALAGKTTNVQGLQRAFAEPRRSELVSPGTTGERTLFLDWLKVDTGLVAGRRLSCHFITVPGQRVLSRRREFLLDLADVVVFVCSAEPEMLHEAVSSFGSLRRRLENEQRVFPLVVQLNKTDCASAIDEARLRRELGLDQDVPIVPAVATKRIGIRETVVLAIRKAADHIQNQILRDGFESLNSPIGDANDLQKWIVAHEKEDGRSPVEVVLQAHQFETSPASVPPAPRLTSIPPGTPAPDSAPLPSTDLPSGMVWPANEGRELLKRALDQKRGRGSVDAGIWRMEAGFWNFSRLVQWLDPTDEGKTVLLSKARTSLQLGPLCLPRLVWCLSRTSEGHTWLWRVAADPASLEDHLTSALARNDETRVEECLRLFVSGVKEMSTRREKFSSPVGTALSDFAVLGHRVHAFQHIHRTTIHEPQLCLAEPLTSYSLPPSLERKYLDTIENDLGTELREQVAQVAYTDEEALSASRPRPTLEPTGTGGGPSQPRDNESSR